MSVGAAVVGEGVEVGVGGGVVGLSCGAELSGGGGVEDEGGDGVVEGVVVEVGGSVDLGS